MNYSPWEVSIIEKVTIDVIAREAEVSKSTVSRFINNLHYISQEKRDKIKKVIDKYGFKPNSTTKMVQAELKDTVALITLQKNIADDSGSSIYFSEFLPILNIELSKYKLQTMLKTIPENARMDVVIPDLADLIESKRISAIIILGELKDVQIIEFLRNSRIPILFHSWEYDADNFDNVMGSDASAIQEAVSCLVSNGCRNIGFVNGQMSYIIFKKRQSMFKLALLEHDLLFHPEWAIETKNNYLGGFEAFGNLKKNSQSLPDAIFCMSDNIAIGVMDAIKNEGLGIPDDISVIGYDNLVESASTVPSLTTIDSNKLVFAQVMVNKLIMNLNYPDKHLGTIIVPTPLIIRNSTGPAKKSG